ncbi:Phosphatidylinositol 4,5-bisphosphate 3-kinase catalytic subunit beta [Lamellibrachia satsuma]|nr:Phosphatidylinositol 4,5-bisphosphate 3-kinase catalytic subunit beta [Lamellibrachia satsuma]
MRAAGVPVFGPRVVISSCKVFISSCRRCRMTVLSVWCDEDLEATVDCLLPTGVIVPLHVELDTPLLDIKEELWKEAKKYPLFTALLPMSHYVFMCVSQMGEKVEQLDEEKCLCDVRPFYPMLKVIERKGNTAEKVINAQISCIIGRGLNDESGILQYNEIKQFRRNMRQKCEQIRKEHHSQSWLDRVMSLYPPHTASSAELPTLIQEKLKGNSCNITVAIAEAKVSYTLQVDLTSSPDALIRQALSKRAATTGKRPVNSQEYVLKMWGRDEYMLGNYCLSQFMYLRRMIMKDVVPKLLLVPISDVNHEDQIPALPGLPVVPPRKPSLTPKKTTPPPPPPKKPLLKGKKVKKEECCLWDLMDKFTVTAHSATNVAYQNHTKVKLRACIYHAGDTMCSIVNWTERQLEDDTAKWEESATLDISLQDIPRMARLCFMLYSPPEKKTTKAKGKRFKDIVPLSWANIPLFDFRGIMKTGCHTLYMWPANDDDMLSEETVLNPIGTVTQNTQAHCAVCLTVTFHNYNQPGPITYPSFEKVLEVAAQHTDFTKGGKVFKTMASREDCIRQNCQTVMLDVNVVNKGHLESLRVMVERDPLSALHEQEKEMVWNLRYECQYHFPQSLPKLVSCMWWNKHLDVAQMQALLQIWPKLHPNQALELLDFAYADQGVRSYAVSCLRSISDVKLSEYLLQLVQVLKYESYFQCDLVDFLLERALNNRRIGHYLFWLLKSEMHVPSVTIQFGLILEAYCRANEQHLRVLTRQVESLARLKKLSDAMKKIKVGEKGKEELRRMLQTKINRQVLTGFTSILDPAFRLGEMDTSLCKFMDSAKKPLWLVWENEDKFAEDTKIYIMYKSGDDLRQDMLTLQILRVMDAIWQAEGLDLRLSIYGCLTTGDREGLIETVVGAETIANIQKKYASILKSFNKKCLYQWLKEQNEDDKSLDKATEEFLLSCAGYCVATYVLGIKDRHCGNIMLKSNGQMFHIDFGHFLGHSKFKFGVKRERVPFVLTSDFVYVIQRGDKNDSKAFERFEECCQRAYLALRHQSNFLITLFMMMMNTGIPELSSIQDIEYLKNALLVDQSEEQALAHFKAKFKEALKNAWTLMVNNTFHHARH